jgi:hypothetical protein
LRCEVRKGKDEGGRKGKGKCRVKVRERVRVRVRVRVKVKIRKDQAKCNGKVWNTLIVVFRIHGLKSQYATEPATRTTPSTNCISPNININIACT